MFSEALKKEYDNLLANAITPETKELIEEVMKNDTPNEAVLDVLKSFIKNERLMQQEIMKCCSGADFRALERKRRINWQIMRLEFDKHDEDMAEDEGFGEPETQALKSFMIELDSKRHYLKTLEKFIKAKFIQKKYGSSYTPTQDEYIQILGDLYSFECYFEHDFTEVIFSRFFWISGNETKNFCKDFKEKLNDVQTLPDLEAFKQDMFSFIEGTTELIKQENRAVRQKRPLPELPIELESEEDINTDEECLNFLVDLDSKKHHLSKLSQYVKRKYAGSSTVTSEEIDNFFKEDVLKMAYSYATWITVQEICDFRKKFENELNDAQTLPDWAVLKQDIINYLKEAATLFNKIKEARKHFQEEVRLSQETQQQIVLQQKLLILQAEHEVQKDQVVTSLGASDFIHKPVLLSPKSKRQKQGHDFVLEENKDDALRNLTKYHTY